MPLRPARILVVEGTCGAGKTTLLRRLATALESNGTPVDLWTQRLTYAPLVPYEDAGTVDARRQREHLDTLVWRLRSRSRSRRGFILVDTLHVTQRLRPGRLAPEDFDRIDADLAALGARHLLVTATRDQLHQRLIEGRRGTGFMRYGQKFGASEREILDYFTNEQEHLRRVVTQQSRLPHRVLPPDACPDASSMSKWVGA